MPKNLTTWFIDESLQEAYVRQQLNKSDFPNDFDGDNLNFPAKMNPIISGKYINYSLQITFQFVFSKFVTKKFFLGKQSYRNLDF